MKAPGKHQGQRGQGMTEYIIIVALIAVAAIGVYQYFGDTVRYQTASMAYELAGKDGKTAKDQAGDAAESAGKKEVAHRNLSNFTSNTAK